MGLEQREVHIPVEQATIIFYDSEIIAIRLPDGRIAAVLVSLCDAIGLARHGQLERIQREEVLSEQLLLAEIATAGGPQVMNVLTAWAIPSWLHGIRLGKVAPEKRAAILAFKREAADVLYRHFSERHALPSPNALVPSGPVTEPVRPIPEANRGAWITYHQQMAAWLEWQEDIEKWRDSVESRLESVEEVTRLIPELFERLPPRTLNPAHQSTVQAMVKRLHDLAGFSFTTIYSDLNAAFHVGKYSEIPDAQWPQVAAWFKQRIDAAEKRRTH